MLRRLSLVLLLSLSLTNCVRAGDGSVDVHGSLLRGARFVCGAVELLPDKPTPDAGAPGSTAASSPELPSAPRTELTSPLLALPRNPFTARDAGP